MTAMTFARPAHMQLAMVMSQSLLRAEPSTFVLRQEKPRDVAAREALLDAAFGPSRFTKTCERLREGRLPAQQLAFIAEDDEAVVGTLRFWHVDAGGVSALMLGPLAVAASHRSLGLGGAMIRHGLAQAGHTAVILVGDAPYYARFGFERRFAAALELPGPVDTNRFLALELSAQALKSARGAVRATGNCLPVYSAA